MDQPTVIETPNAPLTADTMPVPTPPVTTEIKVGTGTIDAAKELGLTMPKVIGPAKLLGEDPEEAADAFAAATGGERRKRDPQTGKFLPKEGESAPAAKSEAVKSPPAPATKVTAVQPPAAPVASSKVKIGEVEKTPEEWAAHVKDLEEKAKPKAPEVTEVPAKPDPTPEERTAAQQKVADDFLTTASARYTVDPVEFDKILAGGPEAVKQFAQTLAKVEMHSRQWAAAQLNQVHEMLEPVLAHQRQIAEFNAEREFLGAHKDIADNPAGPDKFREINAAHHSYYDTIQQKIAQNTASPTERAWATIFDNLTPEQFHADIATKTRAALASIPAPAVPAAAPVATPAPVKPAPVARATPVASDRPGGSSAAAPVSAEAKLAASVFNYQP